MQKGASFEISPPFMKELMRKDITDATRYQILRVRFLDLTLAVVVSTYRFCSSSGQIKDVCVSVLLRLLQTCL